jgi:hypothetical protein
VLDEPVVVLTAARSGSTLLRLILDAHPDLACPAETNFVKICAQLASVFETVDGDPAADVTGRVRDGIRGLVSAVFAEYLTQRKKLRWCDKSLGTAMAAQWFAGVYPKAKFICLYRHGMDVIYSGLEASPWGLTGYGFDQFSGAQQRNNVSALAAYWIEHTSHILEFEEQSTDRSLRVYYERLVEDPEGTAEQVFSFLGTEYIPGLTSQCLSGRSPETGPGDHKVRATRRITADSVGRGVRIPVDTIPPLQRKVMNHLLAELGYALVDHAWRTSPCPPTVLRPPDGDRDAAAGPADDGFDARQVLTGDGGSQLVSSFLESIGSVICARVNTAFMHGLPSDDRGEPAGPGKLALVAYHSDEHRLARSWLIDPQDRTIAEVAGADLGAMNADWLVTGDVETWLGVLSGRANMAVRVRAGMLRYIDLGDGQQDEDQHEERERAGDRRGVSAAEWRLQVVRQLLGLAAYPEEVSQ